MQAVGICSVPVVVAKVEAEAEIQKDSLIAALLVMEKLEFAMRTDWVVVGWLELAALPKGCSVMR